MGSGAYKIQSGGKGYKPPYSSHEAMCVVKQKGIGSFDSLKGSKKVTEGRKPPLLNKSSSSSSHGDRGYQAAKVRGKK